MNAVSELHLIIPGVCGPLAEVESLESDRILKRWVKTLSRAYSDAAADNLNDTIKSVFNLKVDGDLPTAALTMHANDLHDASMNYLHADPVHLRADLDHAVLTSSDDLAIEENEADELCAALNQHFNQDGLTFFSINKNQWILASDKPVQMSTTPLVDAVGRNVNFILPQGEGSGVWKQMLTEAQMLMHSHQVNINRENAGGQSINSLWLHGSGVLPEIMDSEISSVCSNHELFKGLSSLTKSDFLQLPNSVKIYSEFLLSREAESVNVLHISELEHLVNYTDVSIWLHRLSEVLDEWIYPLVELAIENKIKVTIYPCNNKKYQFSKYDFLKVWRKGSLDQHVKSY